MVIRLGNTPPGPLPRETIEGLAKAQQKQTEPQKPLDTLLIKKGDKGVGDTQKFSSTPSTPGGAKSEPGFLKESARLEGLIRAGGPGVEMAAQQAMRHLMKYALRRSKGARKRALGLCDAICDEAPENEELAGQLKEILLAEGELQEVSPEGTLRACKRLVELLNALDSD